MAFIDDIVMRLVHEGVGVVGTSIFQSSRAILPVTGNILTVIETGGSGPARTHNNTGTQRPTAQIKARGVDYPAARALSKSAYDALGGPNGLWNVLLNGTMYLSITMRQEPTDTGLDETGKRSTITFNIDAEKEPT